MGLENFNGLLHSIKHQLQIEIAYKSYWASSAVKKKVEPYRLKEFKKRWYLIARDVEKQEIRTYGLDRIEELIFSKRKFKFPADFNRHSYFDNSFGIIKNDSSKPVQEILLRFGAHQGKYIKSLPLHKSQVVLKETEEETLVKLNVYVTYDLEMELLSYGAGVEVLEPDFLRESIKEKLRMALASYQ